MDTNKGTSGQRKGQRKQENQSLTPEQMVNTNLFFGMAVAPGDPGAERRSTVIAERQVAVQDFQRVALEALSSGAEAVSFFLVGPDGISTFRAGNGEHAIPLKEAAARLLDKDADEGRPGLSSRADEAVKIIAEQALSQPSKKTVAVIGLDGLQTSESDLINALREASRHADRESFGVVLVQVGSDPQAVALVEAINRGGISNVRTINAEDFSSLDASEIAWMGLGGGSQHGKSGTA
jgi:hypothetical protein